MKKVQFRENLYFFSSCTKYNQLFLKKDEFTPLEIATNTFFVFTFFIILKHSVRRHNTSLWKQKKFCFLLSNVWIKVLKNYHAWSIFEIQETSILVKIKECIVNADWMEIGGKNFKTWFKDSAGLSHRRVSFLSSRY